MSTQTASRRSRVGRPFPGIRSVGAMAVLAPILLVALAAPERSKAGAQTGSMTAGSQETAPPGNVENGENLYTIYGCYQCHGRAGQGSARTGPRLGPDPIPFSSFVSIVREPPNQMPPYTARVVTDAELADIYAFVESLPQPPSVESIPLLQ